MYTDTQRLHLFEKLLKTTDEVKLTEVKKILDNSANAIEKKKRTIEDFFGIISHQEGEELKRIIEETSETIHPDDWK